jgi:hypothetical protein
MKNEPIQISIWKGNAEVIFKMNEQNIIPTLWGIAFVLLVHSCINTKRIA